ncbi:MAG: carbonic anhydrase [Hyphomicrobiaceae bacterium]
MDRLRTSWSSPVATAVDPETIFSAMPGELFVVRNVANLVPPFETSGKYHGVSAALEFAALNLRVRHILVIGHSGCGGIRTCLERDAARQTEAQFISIGCRCSTKPARPCPSPIHGPPRQRDGSRNWSAQVSKPLSPICAHFPASKRWKARAASHCTAPIRHFSGALTVLNQGTGSFVEA